MNQERQEQEPSRQYQELGYLREELNQRLGRLSENLNQTVGMVLVIWGAFLYVVEFSGIEFKEMNPKNIFLCLIMATIFFIANAIVYYRAHGFHSSMDMAHRLSAYIAVFYEKRLSSAVQIGKDFLWELTTFEIDHNRENRHKKNIFNGASEYALLSIFSTALILVPLGLLVIGICRESKVKCIWLVIALLICLAYIVISIYLFCKIRGYTYLREDHRMKAEHIKTFIKYADDRGYDTKESLKEKFGEGFWQDVMGCK